MKVPERGAKRRSGEGKIEAQGAENPPERRVGRRSSGREPRRSGAEAKNPE